jgi:hypothetical protein
MTAYDLYIGIDYSGAGTPTARLPGLRVCVARPGVAACEMCPSPTARRSGRKAHWTRRELAEWLRDEACSGRRFLACIDHNFSFPQTYLDRYGLRTWPEFLTDFVRHWPTRGDDVTVDAIRTGDTPLPEGLVPGQRTGHSKEFRLCERWTSSAKSVFQFDMQGSVAKSSHAGIPWLAWLREQVGERIHFWPFDGWVPAPDKAVIAEAYPSIFRNRYPRDDRTVDEQDAYAVARWMADMAERGALEGYFDPPLTAAERVIAEREGWILGIR